MCICKYHRRIGDAGQLSQCDAWQGDVWTCEDIVDQWSGWLWHGWFPVQGVWTLQTSPFDCQVCEKDIDDFVLVVGHPNLEDRHELSCIGVCLECYSRLYRSYGFRNAAVVPDYDVLAEMKQVATERAHLLCDPTYWTFFPDHEYQKAINDALEEIKQLQKLYCRSQGTRRDMLVLAEDALCRIDSKCTNAFWEAEADYGNGTLFMRITQTSGSTTSMRFVASYSAEEDDPHTDVEYYIYDNQCQARRKCVEEVLRLSFKMIETSFRSHVGKPIL